MGVSNHRLKLIGAVCIVTALLSIFFFSYACRDSVCMVNYHFKNWQQRGLRELYDEQLLSLMDEMVNPVNLGSYQYPTRRNKGYYDDFSYLYLPFDIEGNDVMIFLHIQKTGGTIFGWHLVKNLDLVRPCLCVKGYKRCDCFRPNNEEQWLFSRYSTGWKCGVHADWTELSTCVNSRMNQMDGKTKKREYHYITLLREPIHRYLSEFQHIKRGATWKYSKHLCNGRKPTREELPSCYTGSSWNDTTLDSFIACPYNLAHNRQTRMLADLTLVGCYNRSYLNQSERDRIMLASAKNNLARMPFFGLTEAQQVSQYVFEETFKLRFKKPIAQPNTSHADWTLEELTPSQFERLREVNKLDLELYAYAVQLLNSRFWKLRSNDLQFESHFAELDKKNRSSIARVDLKFSSTDKSTGRAVFSQDEDDKWLEDYLGNP